MLSAVNDRKCLQSSEHRRSVQSRWRNASSPAAPDADPRRPVYLGANDVMREETNTEVCGLRKHVDSSPLTNNLMIGGRSANDYDSKVARTTTDLYKYSPDTVPPIHVVSYHVATDKSPP